MRTLKSIFLCGAACAVLAAPGAARAWQVDEAAAARRLAIVDDFSRMYDLHLDAAEAARQRGDCDGMGAILNQLDGLYGQTARQIVASGKFAPGTFAEELARFAAARVLPCPPPGIAQPPPRAAAPATGAITSPTTPVLAQPRWVTEGAATEAKWRKALEVAPAPGGVGQQIDPVQPRTGPRPPVSSSDPMVVRWRTGHEAALAKAEAARQAGDCAGRAAILEELDKSAATFTELHAARSGFPPGFMDGLRQARRAAEALPCPVPKPPETPPPAAQTPSVASTAPPRVMEVPSRTPVPPPPFGPSGPATGSAPPTTFTTTGASGQPLQTTGPTTPPPTSRADETEAQMQERMSHESSGDPMPDTPAPPAKPPVTKTDQQVQAEYQAKLLKEEIDRIQFEQRYDLQQAAAAGTAAVAAGDCPGRDAAAARLKDRIDTIQRDFSDWNQADLDAAKAALDALKASPCPPPTTTASGVGTVPGRGVPAGPMVNIGGGFMAWIAGDGQAFCTYGPSVPQPTSPGSTPGGDDPRDGPGAPDNDDPRDGPPKAPDVPPAGERTPAQQAAYYRWYNEAAEYYDKLDGASGDDPRDAPTSTPLPSTTTRDNDDPKDKPVDDDPRDQPVRITIIIKATAQAQAATGQSSLGRTQTSAKLFPDSVMQVALPSEGGARPQTDSAEDPITCVTGTSGTCTVQIDPCQFGDCTLGSGSTAPIEVDMFATSTTSYVLQMATGGQVPQQLQKYVIGQNLIGGQTFVVVMADLASDEFLQKLIGQAGAQIANVEINICRDKQPGPPSGEPLLRGAGAWGQKHDDQWAIKRVGLTLGADSAWNRLGPSPKPVIVAVIDTGLDWNHLDFAWKNLWKNPGEKPGNGLDDDRNGYVDDVIGWDFMTGTNKPWDHDGHGTLVAGIIAADSDNKQGIAGINPHARIMVLKALNAFGHTRASYVAEAIVYAANNGARVINLSVGGPKLTKIETAAIAHARAKGVVVVVAAGNEGVNVADFGLAGSDGVITVGAANLDDSHPTFSNWGAAVDIAAPGVDVLSLRARRTDTMLGIKDVPYKAGAAYVGADKRYYRVSGTSFAAPVVAGVASLLISKRPELTAQQVENILIQSAQDIQTPGVDQFSGAGMVDARAALDMDPAFRIEAHISGLEVVRTPAGMAVRVTGAAASDQYQGARIEVGAGENPKTFKTVIADVRAAAGALGEIPAAEFKGAPVWTVRLVVTRAGGKTREARYVLDVGG